MSMRQHRRTALWAAIAAGTLAGSLGAAAAAAQEAAPRISDGVVKIGLILDLSGPYSDTTGIGSATAARMAVADFGGKVLGAPIEVVVADGTDSSDHAAAIARDWFSNQHVDAIMDVTGSSPALIVQRIADTRHKIVILNSAVAARLSNEACTATSIHYTFDTQAMANTVAAALVASGKKTWFFITVDYSFGYDLEHDTEAVVEAQGGKVLGGALHPLGTKDFTSYLARAQQSDAQAIGIANGGADLENTIRQAAARGMLPGPQVLVGLAMRINGVASLGLATTQGMVMGEPFYWDLNEATRDWSKRYFDRVKKMPNGLQAGVYSATMHYLQAIAAAGTDATEPVMRAMRAAPINDFFAHDGHIRADGVMVHDMYLFQVKTPVESHRPWDDLKLLATIPGDKAFAPLAQSKCPLVEH